MAHLPARCFDRQGTIKKPAQETMDSPLSPDFALLAANLAACLATIPAGRQRAAVAAPRAALGWAKWPRAARVGGRGAVPGRPQAIICQKFAALCLFKPPPRASLIRPGKKSAGRLAGSGEGFLGMIVRCRDRTSGWAGAAARKPAGRNRARVGCIAGQRSPAGLLGARTSPQPGLTVVQAG